MSEDNYADQIDKLGLIEIDVIGYKQGFNRLAKDAANNAEANMVYSFRSLEISEIASIEDHQPLGADNEFRSAHSAITLKSGEVIHSPRNVDEIKQLRAEAIMAPTKEATVLDVKTSGKTASQIKNALFGNRVGEEFGSSSSKVPLREGFEYPASGLRRKPQIVRSSDVPKERLTFG